MSWGLQDLERAGCVYRRLIRKPGFVSALSQFTKEATKSDLIKVSRNQRPCTGNVKAIRCELTDEAMGDLQGVKNIVLVDTPAFLTGYNSLDARNAFMTWFDKIA